MRSRTNERAAVRRLPNSPAVGGAPTETAVLTVQNKQNDAVVRLSVSRADEFAHVLETVVRAPTCSEEIAQSLAIVDSIQYTR